MSRREDDAAYPVSGRNGRHGAFPFALFGVPGRRCAQNDTGDVFCGCNVENASFPEGCCAETTAIGHMVMGGGQLIAEIAVVAAKKALITPCGGCRQRIAEFGTPETLIYLCDGDGVKETVRLGDLLPKAFGQEAL